MKFQVHSDEHVTRVEIENGAKLYFNLRDYRRYAHRETPLLCVFYEGPQPDREMDYFEMSIYLLDHTPMIGDVPLGTDHRPGIRFLNLTHETTQSLEPALAAGYSAFVERHFARLEDLAQTNLREVA
jgi:hypothetical protein